MRLFPFLEKKKAEALTPQQHKQIQAAIHKRKPTGPPRTAQQPIPFQRMLEAGTCRARSQ